MFRSIFQFFVNNSSKLHTEVVFYSSFSLIIAGLLAAFIFGYVTWETSDSLFQDTDLMTASEAHVVYVKRALCISIFFLTLFAIGYAYTNTFDSISTSAPISAISVQPLSVANPMLDLYEKNLRLTTVFLQQNLDLAAEYINSKNYLASLFEDFFGKTRIGKIPSLDDDIKAYLVRTLVRLYKDPEHAEALKAGAQAYSDYKSGVAPKPTSILPFLQSLLVSVLKL